MSSRSRWFLFSTVGLFLAGGTFVWITTVRAGSSASADARALADASSATAPAVRSCDAATAVSSVGAATAASSVDAAASSLGTAPDAPLAEYRSRLLDAAFAAASKFPSTPHAKTRSKTQEAVAATCLELDQPRRALECIEAIEDWRRGTGYADFAFYCAQHGDEAGARRCLDRAREVIARKKDAPGTQDWQIDRIRIGMARTEVLLDDYAAAAELENGTADFEAAKLEAMKADLVTTETLDVALQQIDLVVVRGLFDQTKGALETCARLYERFYDDVDRRARIEAKIKSSWSKLPLLVRVELMIDLTRAALGREDRAKALELVDETRAIVDGARWLPEDRVPLLARLAALRFRAGAAEQARAELDDALAMYQSEKNGIQSADRARALRPVAEAYRSMERRDTALAVYRTAIEAGAENTNARPRAEDLSATCRSMARYGVDPDAELWARIERIRDGLIDPW